MLKMIIYKIALFIPVAFIGLLAFNCEVKAQSAPDIDTVYYDGGITYRIFMSDSEELGCTGADLFFVLLDDSRVVAKAEFNLPQAKDFTVNFVGSNASGDFIFQAVIPKLPTSTTSCPDFSTWDRYNGTPSAENDTEELQVLLEHSFTEGQNECEGTCPRINSSSSKFTGGKYRINTSNIFDQGSCNNDGLYYTLVTASGDEITNESEAKKGNTCDIYMDEDFTQYMIDKANDEADKVYTEKFNFIWAAVVLLPEFDLCYDANQSDGFIGNCEDDPGDPGQGGPDIDLTCEGLKNEDDRVNCQACFDKNEEGDSTSAFVWSELGCFDTSQNGFTVRIFQIGFGLYGGIVLVRVGMAALAMQDRDPAKIKEFREILNAALWSLAALAGAIPILQFLGLNVLGIFPSNFFT